MLIVLVLLIGWCAPVAPGPSDDAAETAEVTEPVQQESRQATGDQKAQFTSLYRRTLNIGRACDAANTVAVAALNDLASGAADVYSAYSKANSAESACTDAVDKYGALLVDATFPDEIETELRESIDRCETGYQARVSGLGTLKEVMDGDARPSLVQSFQDNQQLARSAVMLCAAGFSDAGLKLGLTVKELEQAGE